MLKKYSLIILLSLVFIALTPAIAGNGLKLQLVYPANRAKISASSTFLIGSTSPDACLTINGKPAKVWEDGSFVEVVPLFKGINKFLIQSQSQTAKKELNYFVTVPVHKVSAKHDKIKPVFFTAQVTRDYAVTRNAPEQNRLTPLLKGTLLSITGKSGNNYRFKYSDNFYGWISKHSIKPVSNKNNQQTNSITNINLNSDGDYEYLRIAFSNKTPLIIEQPSPDKIKIKLFRSLSSGNLLANVLPPKSFVKELSWQQEAENCLSVSIKANSPQFWGYKYYYEGNNFVLRLKKPPEVNFFFPMVGKKICIDAGHGGKELGSVGPTAIPEKNINLAIAQNLKSILESRGAKVIMTRNSDRFVGLYDRVELADENNADILISIHNNALPDGKNPYETHGTTTYYYHNQSLPLAHCLQKSLAETLGFNDLGVLSGSFVLTRPFEQPSVLVEVGFMINPEEYRLLVTPEFQEKTAFALAQGVENFFLSK